jgi:sugar lactone lactonase YvrE
MTAMPLAPSAVLAASMLLVASACHHAGPADDGVTPGAAGVTTLSGVGLDEPENVVYDSAADVFLVSNIVGNPAARDDNGFISRVSPDGRLLALRWIAGGVRGAVLDAPKGLAIRGDTLAIADVGAVHLFNRVTGAPIATIRLHGQVMNDVAWAPDGSLWITDTGPDRSHSPVDTSADVDAVWRAFPDGRVQSVARGLWLDRPDGLVLRGSDALVATFGARRIERVAPGATAAPVERMLPGGRVDGLRREPDGSLLVSSWDAGTVWRLARDGALHPLLTHVQSPAGIAVDTRRGRLAVTSMQGNAFYLLPLH